jgi:hypothetical protein
VLKGLSAVGGPSFLECGGNSGDFPPQWASWSSSSATSRAVSTSRSSTGSKTSRSGLCPGGLAEGLAELRVVSIFEEELYKEEQGPFRLEE